MLVDGYYTTEYLVRIKLIKINMEADVRSILQVLRFSGRTDHPSHIWIPSLDVSDDRPTLPLHLPSECCHHPASPQALQF